jgi:hypothetical protein
MMDYETMDAEIKRWKRIAVYLASCHAATAEYDGQLRGTSRSRKNRYSSLCEKAAKYLKGIEDPPIYFPSDDKLDLVEAIRRCESACAALKKEGL